MKTYKFITAVALSGSLLLGGCSDATPTQPANAVTYQDEYQFILYRVSSVTPQGEIFGEALDGKEGLWVDKNDINAEKGDIVRGVFDASDGEYISVEMYEEATIIAEDGSKVTPSFYNESAK